MRFLVRLGELVALFLTAVCELPGQDSNDLLSSPVEALEAACRAAAASDTPGLDSLQGQWMDQLRLATLNKDIALRGRDQNAAEVARVAALLKGKRHELASLATVGSSKPGSEEIASKTLRDRLEFNIWEENFLLHQIEKLRNYSTLDPNRDQRAARLQRVQQDLLSVRRREGGKETWQTQLAALRSDIKRLERQRLGGAIADRADSFKSEIRSLEADMNRAREELALARSILGKSRAIWAVVMGMQPRVQSCIDQRRAELGITSALPAGRLTGTYRGYCGTSNVETNGTFSLSIPAQSGEVTGTFSEPGGSLSGHWKRTADGSASGPIAVNGGGGQWSGLLVQSASGSMKGQGTASYSAGGRSCAVNWKGP